MLKNNDKSEAENLQELLRATDRVMQRAVDEIEATGECSNSEYFTIEFNDATMTFLAGSMQTEALYAFISMLADGNGYEVSYKELTVVE